MSELKEHIFSDIDEVFPRGYCGPLPSQEARPYYLKSEADKVFAAKDKAISELKEAQRWRKFPDEKPKWGEEVTHWMPLPSAPKEQA